MTASMFPAVQLHKAVAKHIYLLLFKTFSLDMAETDASLAGTDITNVNSLSKYS